MKTKKSGFKHGHHGGRLGKRTPTYNSWRKMRERCNNPNQVGYHNYGGRGVSIYFLWDDFSEFLADMGERPEGTTIDRINPDGHYTPSNCRWATAKEQARNRRNSRETPSL